MGYTTITTFGKFVRNMMRKVAKDTMHDELGCGTSRSVVNNYTKITRNVHRENVKGRKKKNQKWIILIRDSNFEKEKWHTHVQCRRNQITLKE
jgi:hypothetical protein